MNKYSVLVSDFLTNDSLVPAFVFGRESQRALYDASAPNMNGVNGVNVNGVKA